MEGEEEEEGLEGEEEGLYELDMLHTIKVKIVGLCNLILRMQSTSHKF